MPLIRRHQTFPPASSGSWWFYGFHLSPGAAWGPQACLLGQALSHPHSSAWGTEGSGIQAKLKIILTRNQASESGAAGGSAVRLRQAGGWAFHSCELLFPALLWTRGLERTDSDFVTEDSTASRLLGLSFLDFVAKALERRGRGHHPAVTGKELTVRGGSW